MAIAYAKRAIQNLTSFKSSKWFTKDFKTLALRIATDYATKNEISHGMVATVGTFDNNTSLKLNVTAGEAYLNGVLCATTGLSDQDLMIVTGNVLGAIHEDGSLESAVAYSSATSTGDSYVTVLATNSDGAGSASTADNSTIKYVALIGRTDHLTSTEIASLMSGSEGNATHYDHSAAKYVIVAQIKGENAAETVTGNRNNVLGQ